MARDLGICTDSLRNWLKAAGVQMGQASRLNCEQQRIRELEAENRALRKQLVEKEEVIDVLKKSVGILVETIEKKYRCVLALSRQGATVEQACRELDVSRSGYYEWLKHKTYQREQDNQVLKRRLIELHKKYPDMGLNSLYHTVKPEFHCSRKRVHRQMRLADICSARKRAYKNTTNSEHNYPIAPNFLQRKFSFEEINQAWVGDITYIPTG